MTSTRTTGKRTVATLLVAIGAAIIVAPALAAAEDDCEPTRLQVLEMVEIAPYTAELAGDIARFEAVAMVDVVDRIDLVERIDFIHFDRLERRESHPMSRGVAALAAIAQIPGRLAIGAQHTVEALVKATPRVLRAIL